MDDPTSLGTMDVLIKVLPPALFTDPNLLSLTVCRAVNLSLEQGTATAHASLMCGLVQYLDPTSATTRLDFVSASSAMNWLKTAACSASRPEPICGSDNSSCHGQNISGLAGSCRGEGGMPRLRE